MDLSPPCNTNVGHAEPPVKDKDYLVSVALKLFEHNVIPIPVRQKRPLLQWRKFLDGHPPPTEEDIVRWFSEKDADAVAILGPVACLDFDAWPVAFPAEWVIPGGWVIATARGIHVLFAWDGPRVDVRIAPKIEFVSAKPIIVDGIEYHSVLGDLREALETPAPAWLVELVRERATKRPRPTPLDPLTLEDRLLASEELAKFVIERALGLTQPYRGLGKALHCPLHAPDHHPSLVPWRNARGHVIFKDFHTGACLNAVELFLAVKEGLAPWECHPVQKRNTLAALAKAAGLLGPELVEAWWALVREVLPRYTTSIRIRILVVYTPNTRKMISEKACRPLRGCSGSWARRPWLAAGW